MSKQLLVITGPTGSGKTLRSLESATRYNCPIVCADSRQIYRDLPIGTAAPTEQERSIAPHYLVGFKDLTDTYNAGQFARDADAIIRQLFEEHDRVIVVGGSMLYLEALCVGLDEIPSVPQEVRSRVQADYREKGLEWLQNQVQDLDPNYWDTVDKANPQRLMHALEVVLASGRPYSSFRGHRTPAPKNYSIQWEIVILPREELYQRINHRVIQMMDMGLEQEAHQAFTKLGISLHGAENEMTETLPNSVNTVGYKEMLNYFRGIYSREKAIEMIQQNTRHYAKRQMTWWRNRI